MILGPAILDDKIWFPPPASADEDGLLAIGGDLGIDRLLVAYRQGIFPWYNGPLPLWWHPDPRFVLLPENLEISKSMKQVLRRQQFSFTQNAAFRQVLEACGTVPRRGQAGTWITGEILVAYTQLYEMGYAVSYEAWQGNMLAGGLYGIRIGHVFFGESMFSQVSNASKAAFIVAVNRMKDEGVKLIDCQVYTPHLESLGATMIPRIEFLQKLQELLD